MTTQPEVAQFLVQDLSDAVSDSNFSQQNKDSVHGVWWNVAVASFTSFLEALQTAHPDAQKAGVAIEPFVRDALLASACRPSHVVDRWIDCADRTRRSGRPLCLHWLFARAS